MNLYSCRSDPGYYIHYNPSRFSKTKKEKTKTKKAENDNNNNNNNVEQNVTTNIRSSSSAVSLSKYATPPRPTSPSLYSSISPKDKIRRRSFVCDSGRNKEERSFYTPGGRRKSPFYLEKKEEEEEESAADSRDDDEENDEEEKRGFKYKYDSEEENTRRIKREQEEKWGRRIKERSQKKKKIYTDEEEEEEDYKHDSNNEDRIIKQEEVVGKKGYEYSRLNFLKNYSPSYFLLKSKKNKSDDEYAKKPSSFVDCELQRFSFNEADTRIRIPFPSTRFYSCNIPPCPSEEFLKHFEERRRSNTSVVKRRSPLMRDIRRLWTKDKHEYDEREEKKEGGGKKLRGGLVYDESFSPSHYSESEWRKKMRRRNKREYFNETEDFDGDEEESEEEERKEEKRMSQVKEKKEEKWQRGNLRARNESSEWGRAKIRGRGEIHSSTEEKEKRKDEKNICLYSSYSEDEYSNMLKEKEDGEEALRGRGRRRRESFNKGRKHKYSDDNTNYDNLSPDTREEGGEWRDGKEEKERKRKERNNSDERCKRYWIANSEEDENKNSYNYRINNVGGYDDNISSNDSVYLLPISSPPKHSPPSEYTAYYDNASTDTLARNAQTSPSSSFSSSASSSSASSSSSSASSSFLSFSRPLQFFSSFTSTDEKKKATNSKDNSDINTNSNFFFPSSSSVPSADAFRSSSFASRYTPFFFSKKVANIFYNRFGSQYSLYSRSSSSSSIKNANLLYPLLGTTRNNHYNVKSRHDLQEEEEEETGKEERRRKRRTAGRFKDTEPRRNTKYECRIGGGVGRIGEEEEEEEDRYAREYPHSYNDEFDFSYKEEEEEEEDEEEEEEYEDKFNEEVRKMKHILTSTKGGKTKLRRNTIFKNDLKKDMVDSSCNFNTNNINNKVMTNVDTVCGGLTAGGGVLRVDTAEKGRKTLTKKSKRKRSVAPPRIRPRYLSRTVYLEEGNEQKGLFKVVKSFCSFYKYDLRGIQEAFLARRHEVHRVVDISASSSSGVLQIEIGGFKTNADLRARSHDAFEVIPVRSYDEESEEEEEEEDEEEEEQQEEEEEEKHEHKKKKKEKNKRNKKKKKKKERIWGYVFSTGVVVIWGLEGLPCDYNELTSNFMWFLAQYAEEPIRADWLQEDTMLYGYIDELQAAKIPIPRSRVKYDHIYLKTYSSAEKFAASLAMAQSIRLSIYETAIDLSIRRVKALPERMAKLGNAACTETEYIQLNNRTFADIYNKIIDVNIVQDFLDVPEHFWNDDTWEHFWRKIHKYLEIKERIEVLNKRYSCIQEMLAVVHNERSTAQHDRLMWILIWLIVSQIIAVAFRNYVGRDK